MFRLSYWSAGGMRVGGCRGGIHMPSLRDSIVAACIALGLKSQAVVCNCSAVNNVGKDEPRRVKLQIEPVLRGDSLFRRDAEKTK